MIKSTVDLTSNRDFGFNGLGFDFRNIHIDYKKRRNMFGGLFDFSQDNQATNFENFWLIDRIPEARDYYYDVSNHCARCGKSLKKEMPWFSNGELCKQCYRELSSQYFKGWTHQKNSGWIEINLDNSRIPFESWF